MTGVEYEHCGHDLDSVEITPCSGDSCDGDEEASGFGCPRPDTNWA